ncbi:MAG: FxLYD domain-containing protein [Candidatus Bathyarchaeota archaeon]|nr:FxLYD domain-containing protein [Candidatus Bathyarchaeota archaeon]
MKNKLSACFLLLTIVCGLSLTSFGGVSAQTENVRIISYSYYIDMLGNLVVVGEVQNVGNTVIDYVVVSGAVTGSDGSYVESGNRVWALNLIPGQKAPFYLDFLSKYTNSQTWYVGVADVSLSIYQAPSTTKYQYQEVKVLDDKPAPTSEGEYWVKGNLKNNGAQTATDVTVLATFYNSSGTVVAIGYSTTISSLAAGATTSFKVAAFDLNQTLVSPPQKIAGYSLLVQVKSPMQTGTAPVANTTIIPVPTTAPTANNSDTEANTDQNVIYVGVVVAVVIAVIVASVLLKRRKPADKPVSQKPLPKKQKRK